MIGCTVKATSSSGWRGMRTRFRSARISVSPISRLTRAAPRPPATTRAAPRPPATTRAAPRPPATTRAAPGASRGPLPVVRLLRGMAGERQEHVVERRAAQRQVVDADPRLAEAAHRRDDRPAPLAHGDPHHPFLEHRAILAEPRQRGECRVAVGAGLELDLEPEAADAALELIGRPLRDHRAVVDHR